MALDGHPGSSHGPQANCGFSTLLVGTPAGEDPVAFVRRLGENIAPRVRELLG